MKTAFFELKNPEYLHETDDHGFPKSTAIYRIPTLPAYAISHYTVNIEKISDELFSQYHDSYEGEYVHISGLTELDEHRQAYAKPTFQINYLGILDYKKLFPHFRSDSLRERAGQFMEEADKAFDNSAWMSFLMMAGAVVECVLFDLLKKSTASKATFGQLTKDVKNISVLDENDVKTIFGMVEARNLIHAGRYETPFVGRKLAIKTRLTLDNLLKMDWSEMKNGKD